MTQAHPPAVLCGDPMSALEAVAPAGDGGLAVLVETGLSAVTIAFMSPFGACVSRHPEDGAFGPEAGSAFLAMALMEARRKGSLVALSYEDPADGDAFEGLLTALTVVDERAWDLDAGLAWFRKCRPEVPVRIDARGRERATTWTVAPLGVVPFERGDSLSLSVMGESDRSVLGWRGSGGRDAGIHIVLPRAATLEENAVAEEADGIVVCAIHGEMPSDTGPRTVQTLVIDVPAAVARGFPDGHWPRHGIVGTRGQDV